jgi:DNA-directed RNA polymerase subunit RPC12/RpoP
MEFVAEGPSAVRCAACHEVYEPVATSPTASRETSCPRCGHEAWLAVRVPVDETSGGVPT